MFRQIKNQLRAKISSPSKNVHIKKGEINRFDLKPGDIFLEYDSLEHTGIRFAQKIFSPNNIGNSNFVHGGIILDNKKLIHADGSPNLHVEDINDLLDHKKYYIFRPVNPLIARQIVKVAESLRQDKVISYPKYEHKLFSESKTNRSLFRFSKKSKQVKDLNELQAELLQMLDLSEYNQIMNSKAMQELRKAQYKDLKYRYTQQLIAATKDEKQEIEQDIEEEIDKNVVKQVLTICFKGKKQFYCTQFVTWVIQMAVGELKQEDKISYKITDVLNIRDTKATPARLASILKTSPHFVEYKSLERYIKPEDR